MSTDKQQLHKLIVTARQAYAPQSAPAATAAPFGFATRIAARWVGARRHVSRGDLWERISCWGASVSVAVCVAAFTQQMLQPEPNVFDLVLEMQAVDSELP